MSELSEHYGGRMLDESMADSAYGSAKSSLRMPNNHLD